MLLSEGATAESGERVWEKAGIFDIKYLRNIPHFNRL